MVREVVKHNDHIRGVLAQKPLGVNLAEAVEIVQLCESAGITLAVNQNMRDDQSIRACHDLIGKGYLGEPVFASIDMRAIPHQGKSRTNAHLPILQSEPIRIDRYVG